MGPVDELHDRRNASLLYFPDAPLETGVDDAVRLLAPFDPIVWDRRRFQAFWRWPYRFEAYTPPAKRQYGY